MKNTAPIDIIFEIIDRRILDDIDEEDAYAMGRKDGLRDLKAELENLQKLFN